MNYPLLKPADAFLGLPPEDAATFAEAKAVIIPFGLEASVSYGSGTHKGPQAILKASKEVELFDEQLWCEPFRDIGIVTLQPPQIANDLEAALAQLAVLNQAMLQLGKFPLILGGEHSLTAGAIRPFAERYQDLVILHFDAHADLRDGYAGQHYSHAAALRRCLDYPHVTLISVGIRNISAEEISFLQANRHRIHIHWAKDKDQWDMDQLIKPLCGCPIYLSFDLDGFDSSLMPATGTPEPGGLFWHEALNIITAAANAGTIVGADVNELAPIPGLHACDFLAAKLVYKILGLRFSERGLRTPKIRGNALLHR